MAGLLHGVGLYSDGDSECVPSPLIVQSPLRVFFGLPSLYIDMAVPPRSRSLSRSEASKTNLLLYAHAYDRVSLSTSQNSHLALDKIFASAMQPIVRQSSSSWTAQLLITPALRPELPRAVQAGGSFRPGLEKNFGSDLPKRPNTFSTNRGPHTTAV
jgi:hypothetical protein